MVQLVTSAQFGRTNPVESFFRGKQQAQTAQLNDLVVKAKQGDLAAQEQLQILRQQVLGGGQAPQQAPAGTIPTLGAQPTVPGVSGTFGNEGVPTQAPVAPQLGPSPFEQLQVLNPAEARKISLARKATFDNQTATEQRRVESIVKGAAELQGLPIDRQIVKLEQRIKRLRGQGTPTNDSEEHLALLRAGKLDQANAITDQAVQLGQQLGVLQPPSGARTAGQKEFESLTEGLDPEQEKEARLIKLGLSPRAVGSAIQTIAENDIAETIGDAEATIAQRKKFGELTGSSRAKAIDKGFDRIQKIDVGIGNIDKAIEAVRGGAGTGAVERLFPSIKAASVELDNIQGQMALDVIGAVTFGALSKGELDLAKTVALPTGLDGPELIDFLERKKAAQQKLRAYFQDQIDFLDQGGTVAGFLRSKEREVVGQGAAGADGTKTRIKFDAQGNVVQ